MTNKNNPKTTAIIPQDRGTKQPIIIIISSSRIHNLITRTARRRGGDGERATPPKQRRQISFVKGGGGARGRESCSMIRGLSLRYVCLFNCCCCSYSRPSIERGFLCQTSPFLPLCCPVRVSLLLLLLCYAQLRLT